MLASSRFHRKPFAGFTIIELLITVSIIALLVAILLPVLGASRDVAEKTRCLSNLRQFGIGFVSYSTENAGAYCSGSTDFAVNANLYGQTTQIDEVGWVADQVNGRFSLPGKLMCPTSLARINKWYDAASPGAARYMDLMAGGYNSNYTQTWYMAHAQFNPGIPSPLGYEKRFNAAGLRLNQGPLHSRLLDLAPASTVPMLADSRADPDFYIPPDGSEKVRIARNLTDGPRLRFTAGTFSEVNNALFGIQDWENLGVNHGAARSNHSDQHPFTLGNLVFADGHAESFKDQFTSYDSPQGGQPRPDGRLDNYDLDGQVFDGVLSLGRRSTSTAVPQ